MSKGSEIIKQAVLESRGGAWWVWYVERMTPDELDAEYQKLLRTQANQSSKEN